MRRLGNLRDWLVDRAVRRGWRRGDRDYVRFVVVTHYRSGSNWFLSLLRNHPRVVAHSEVFFPKRIHWGSAAYSLGEDDPALLQRRDDDPGAFLREAVFRPYAPPIGAVGFKLMYTQAGDDVRAALLGRDDLRVIHLRRRNLLQMLVSQKLARLSGDMSSTSEASARRTLESVGPVELTVDECQAHFERVTALRQEWRDRADLTVDYEDLRDDPQAIAGLTFKALGVEPRRVESPLVRQTTRNLEEVVANHEELVAAFRGTEWEGWGEERIR